MTSDEVTHAFDRQFIHDGLRRDHYWLAVYCSLAGVPLCFLIGWLLHRSWYVGAIAAPLVVAVFVLVLRQAIRRNVSRTQELWQKQSPSGVVRYVIDDDGITVHLDHAQSRHPWASLRRLWRYPDVWMLEIVRMRSVLFPPRAASDEVKEFITARCRAAGVRV